MLSSSITDEIQQEVPYNVHVTWGQVLKPDDVLSGEIDIIIYLGKPLYQWRSIGYSIILSENVSSVFEVKRNFIKYGKHRADYLRLRKFAAAVYLRAYRTHTTMANIRKREEKLKEIGCTDVFHLVRWTMDRKEGREVPKPIYDDWYRLMETVGTLK